MTMAARKYVSGGPSSREDLRRLVAAAQVLRPGVVAQAAQVHDPADALFARHAGEGVGSGSLARLEVAVRAPAAHRVHQVVRHVDVAARAAKRVRVEHVPLVKLVARLCEVRRSVAIAHEAAHVDAVCREGRREPATDEAGGACDEYPHN